MRSSSGPESDDWIFSSYAMNSAQLSFWRQAASPVARNPEYPLVDSDFRFLHHAVRMASMLKEPIGDTTPRVG